MNAFLVAPPSTFPSPFLRFSVASIFLATLLILLKFSYTQISGLKAATITSHHGIDITKLQLLRCRISHHRLIPKTHAFAYRYLGLGIPVQAHVAKKESAWTWGAKWCGILGFRSEAHLGGFEGERTPGLREKLDAVLEAEGLYPQDYPTVYLLTAPTVLGYNFSPASFWFLYREECAAVGELRLEKVLAEVNNTFGEKRSPGRNVGLIAFGMQEKDFHVSPFSSRRGAYILAACDPRLAGRVDVCVTLLTSRGAKKLIARWYSSNHAVDAQRQSWKEVVEILGGWVCLGLLTWPRIVLQAILLAQKRKLEMWHRPEPRQTTVSRRATKGEMIIADVFARYVRHLLSFASGDVRIVVRSGVPAQRPTTTRNAREESAIPADLELRILTPQFYRQLITYPTLSSFLAYTLLDPWEENHTAASHSASALISTIIALEKIAADVPTAGKSPFSALITKTIWLANGALRPTGRLRGAYPNPGLPSARAGTPPVESPRKGESECDNARLFLDEFVCGHFGLGEQVKYFYAAQLRTGIMRILGGQ